ncbi:hypothetical protein BLA29_013697, partial [Euroglyphus maynei]
PNPCQLNHVNPCSHQCLLIPRGYRCSCPDGLQHSVFGSISKCNSAFEHPLAMPYKCECKNGGSCMFTNNDDDNEKIICKCLDNFVGNHCEDSVAKTKLNSRWVLRTTPSLLLLLFALILASLVFVIVYFQKKNL